MIDRGPKEAGTKLKCELVVQGASIGDLFLASAEFSSHSGGILSELSRARQAWFSLSERHASTLLLETRNEKLIIEFQNHRPDPGEPPGKTRN